MEDPGHGVEATERMERIPDDMLLELAAEEDHVFVTTTPKASCGSSNGASQENPTPVLCGRCIASLEEGKQRLKGLRGA